MSAGASIIQAPLPQRPDIQETSRRLMRATGASSFHRSSEAYMPGTSRTPAQRSDSQNHSHIPGHLLSEEPPLPPSDVWKRTAESGTSSKLSQSTQPLQRIPVSYTWERKRVSAQLDMNMTGDNFFSDLERILGFLNCRINRASHYICFKGNINAGDDHEVFLLLEESDMNSNWDGAIDNIRLTFGDSIQRLYASIEGG